MLPIIGEEVRQEVFNEIIQDMPLWRKGMIHYIKDENPEINAAIIDMAQKTDLDPKAVALGAYMVYKMLEETEKADNGTLESILG